MVIHDPDGLQEGIRYHRTHKTDATLLHIFTESDGDIGFCRNFGKLFPMSVDLLSIRKAPEIGIEGTVFLLYFLHDPRVLSDAEDLVPVADQASIGEKGGKLFIRHPGAFVDFKTVERSAVAFSLVYDRRPGKANTCAFQAQHLELKVVIVIDFTPFKIVILFQNRISL